MEAKELINKINEVWGDEANSEILRAMVEEQPNDLVYKAFIDQSEYFVKELEGEDL